VTGVMFRAFVVGSRGVAGSSGRGVVISANETTKVASTDQFFYFILECYAFFCSVAMVAVVAAIFGHISVGGVVVLRGGGIRSACRASSRMRERATVRGTYLVKRGWRGSRGRASGRGLGCEVGLAVVVA